MRSRKTSHRLFWGQGRWDQGPVFVCQNTAHCGLCFVDAALCHQDGLERRRHPSTCQPRSEEQLFKSPVGRAQPKWSPRAAEGAVVCLGGQTLR